MQRRVAHLDMDAFYASVELLRYPQLRGLPVVIGGRHHGHLRTGDNFPRLRDYVGRGVVTTATYEARAFGVHSGMGIMKAARLAPDAILLPADFEQYRHYSRLFKAAVAEIAPEIEDRGIDEIYIDLTKLPGDTVELAQRIKSQRATRNRFVLLHWDHTQQAPRQARLGAAETGRIDGTFLCGSPHPYLAAAGAEHQRHRPEGECKARCTRYSHRWRLGPHGSRNAGSEVWPALRDLAD